MADSFELQNVNGQGRNRLRLAVNDLPRTATDRTQKSFNWTAGLQSLASIGFHTRVLPLEIANRVCQCQLSDLRSEFERQLDPRESDRNGHLCRGHIYVEFLVPDVRLVLQRLRSDVCRLRELDIISLAI